MPVFTHVFGERTLRIDTDNCTADFDGTVYHKPYSVGCRSRHGTSFRVKMEFNPEAFAYARFDRLTRVVFRENRTKIVLVMLDWPPVYMTKRDDVEEGPIE